MRKVLTVATVLIGIVALVLFFHSKKPAADTTAPTQALPTSQPENPSAAENNNNSAPAPASSSASANPALPGPSSPAPAPNLADRAGAVPPAPATPSADIPPAIFVQNVRRAINQFGAMFGGNPVGTNPEITAQLNGGNPKGINFIDPEAGMRINGNGELVDSWGTPLFFHQLSANDTEVRSAGPDKTMWTGDDLVAR
jgi:hypothetical protein